MEPSRKEKDQFGPRWGNASGAALGGVVLVLVGAILLAHQMGIIFPSWLLSWPVLAIVIGLYIGARMSFRLGGWLIPIGIGTYYLVDDYLPDLDLYRYLWPVVIIGLGLFMIVRPARNKKKSQSGLVTTDIADDAIDVVSIFAGTNKRVISKNFKGGEAVNVFGGCELNLTQADFTGRVELEVVSVFGGATLVVPANWKIVYGEVVSILGSTDDKRPLVAGGYDENKVLVLRGVNIFGGLNIKS
jgi:hypothetical protein